MDQKNPDDVKVKTLIDIATSNYDEKSLDKTGVGDEFYLSKFIKSLDIMPGSLKVSSGDFREAFALWCELNNINVDIPHTPFGVFMATRFPRKHTWLGRRYFLNKDPLAHVKKAQTKKV